MTYSAFTSNDNKKWYALAVVLVIVISAFARSYWSYEVVFEPSGVKLLGADPYYHLRHSHQILQDFPVINRIDNNTHFPQGSKNYATGLFNILNAAVTLAVFGADASINQTAAVSAWVAFILGSGCTLLLYLLTASALCHRAALVAIIVFTLFPATFLERSVLGFADQHVAEVLLALALGLALVKLVQLQYSANLVRFALQLLPLVLPMLLLAYTWRGAVIYLPIIALSLLTYLTLLTQQQRDLKPLRWTLFGFGLMTLLLLVFIQWLVPWLAMSPQGSRWLLIGVGCLTLGAWGYLSLLMAVSEALRPKFALMAYFGTVAMVVLVLLVNVQGDWVGTTLLAQREQTVAEHQVVNINTFIWQLGLAGIGAIVGFGVSLYLLHRRQVPLLSVLPLMMGFSLMGLWISSGDFGYVVSPFAAFSCAVLIVYLWPAKLRWTGLTSAIGALIWLSCSLWFNAIPFSRLPWFTAAQVAQLEIYSQGWFSASDWLRQHTPKPNDKSAAEYGVLSPWEFGNIVAAYGQKTAAWSSYPSKHIHHWLMAQSEAQSLSWLCPKCEGQQGIQYVMVDGDSYGPLFGAKAQLAGLPLTVVQKGQFTYKQQSISKMGFDKQHDNAMVSRLYAKDGVELSHYRLVYESPEKHYVGAHMVVNGKQFDYRQLAIPMKSQRQKEQFEHYLSTDISAAGTGFLYDDGIYASVKVFEVVKGANIGGKAREGTQIQVRLPLQVESSGRQLTYQNTVVANEQGRYLLTVPYPTKGDVGSTQVKALSAYQLMVKAPGQTSFSLAGEFDVTLGQVYRQASVGR